MPSPIRTILPKSIDIRNIAMNGILRLTSGRLRLWTRNFSRKQKFHEQPNFNLAYYTGSLNI